MRFTLGSWGSTPPPRPHTRKGRLAKQPAPISNKLKFLALAQQSGCFPPMGNAFKRFWLRGPQVISDRGGGQNEPKGAPDRERGYGTCLSQQFHRPPIWSNSPSWPGFKSCQALWNNMAMIIKDTEVDVVYYKYKWLSSNVQLIATLIVAFPKETCWGAPCCLLQPHNISICFGRTSNLKWKSFNNFTGEFWGFQKRNAESIVIDCQCKSTKNIDFPGFHFVGFFFASHSLVIMVKKQQPCAKKLILKIAECFFFLTNFSPGLLGPCQNAIKYVPKNRNCKYAPKIVNCAKKEWYFDHEFEPDTPFPTPFDLF